MELQDFRDTLVKAYTDVLGQPYITGTDQNDAINRALERFTEETYCLYDDDIALTTQASIGHYDFRDTDAFAQKMLRVMHVWVEGNLIQRVATQRDMTNIEANYIFATPDVPAYWFTQGSTTLMLAPKPASTYADTYVSGWYLHPTLTQENDAIAVPDTDIEAAAMKCALALMHPRAAATTKERYDQLLADYNRERDRIIALRQGRLFFDGPAAAFTPGLREDLYRAARS